MQNVIKLDRKNQQGTMEERNYSEEQWKQVLFEGIDAKEKYEVSNAGRIRRWIVKKNDWAIQRPSNVNGYAYFSFRTDELLTGKKRITKSIHRLVGEMFLTQPSSKHDKVIHVDFNKWNNHQKNLRWVTRAEMFAHSRTSPRTAAAIERRKGEITNSKLTETEVMRLKKKLQRGKTPLYKIAKEFGITHTQLNRIRRNENWAHIKID
ncbi:MAG: HNH endonuclease [Bacteroidota bacterium]|nr:MAG: HNH endonuclease [Bacteroidota bacterium]